MAGPGTRGDRNDRFGPDPNEVITRLRDLQEAGMPVQVPGAITTTRSSASGAPLFTVVYGVPETPHDRGASANGNWRAGRWVRLPDATWCSRCALRITRPARLIRTGFALAMARHSTLPEAGSS